MLLCALLVLPAIVIEQSEPTEAWATVATALDWITWLGFLVEALIMLYVVDQPTAWLRDHPLEVAILIFTGPLLPEALQAARIFRLLRLLRLLRLVVLVRRLVSPEGLRDAAVFVLMTIMLGGVAFAEVEPGELSSWDGVWWAISTVTTVGYGDISPTTDIGRGIAIIVMFAGIGFVALMTAAIAERFLRPDGRGPENDEAPLSVSAGGAFEDYREMITGDPDTTVPAAASKPTPRPGQAARTSSSTHPGSGRK